MQVELGNRVGTVNTKYGPIAKLQYLRSIEETNPTIPYTNEMKPRHVQCTVCLSEFKEEEKVRSLKCQHVFHRDCLDTWLQEYRATCPLCRVKLLPDDVVSKRRVLRSQLDSDVNGGERLPFFLSALHGGS
ncbi:hypothetical protein Ahy_B10g102150 [Arachis hypogaea]|uniref:RING-type domain-containing protein n=1 Tax=Arachis hypogaea TaxID=3818 RepID=A0A444X1D7_ARAHY|nr:hypothetical protein Ahy_B10g102150 [Arachis hypogaea]